MNSLHASRALGRPARVVLSALIALIAVAAFGATSSNAAFTAPYTAKCSGSDIVGEGSSLQGALQPALINYWQTTSVSGQTGGCGAAAHIPNITYNVTDSGGGRNAFGASLAGRNANDRYVAYDRAPNPTEEANTNTAQGGTGAGKMGVIPVAAAALTVISHFPEGCQLPNGDTNLASYARFQVSNSALEAAFSGATTTWGGFLPGIQAIPNNDAGLSDADCQATPLKRVVRGDSSGTTDGFKLYLNGINPSTGWGGAYKGTVWPGTPLTNGSGGGALATKVANTNGSIGYVDLATARIKGFQKSSDTSAPDPSAYTYSASNDTATYPVSGSKTYSFNQSLFWIPLEEDTAGSGVSGSGVFAEPTVSADSVNSSKKGANCATVSFGNVPLNPSTATPDAFGDWSTVNGTLGASVYPACILTFNGWWDDYSDVYGTSLTEQGKARTVRDFLLTSVNSGQNVLNKNDYSRLPTTLKNAATSALNGTSWNK